MPESEGGTNFWDTLSTVVPVAIRAIDSSPTPTGAGAITGTTLLIVGGGLVAIILVVVLIK